jgi:hypothetical protein
LRVCLYACSFFFVCLFCAAISSIWKYNTLNNLKMAM